MSHRPLELGAVYRADFDTDRPMRILAFDETMVMYDTWWPHLDQWGLAGFKGRGVVCYYRIDRAFLLEHATYVRTDPYTDAEFKLHRPDLPMSFAQAVGLEWTPTPPLDIASTSKEMQNGRPSVDSALPSLDTPQVYLEPFGPTGRPKRGMLVEAQNGRSFTEAELLWQAWKLQAPLMRDPAATKGVGLYRSGIQKQIPSYYIWGSVSRYKS